MPLLPPFSELAATPDPPLDVLALALAGEFREVAVEQALGTLNSLGAELRRTAAPLSATPYEEALVCSEVLGASHEFLGDRQDYDHPHNSMLDLVLARRRGLPILLSVVYVEAARRAGIELAGVGLPGHFVVGHFGARPPLLLDPFSGGRLVREDVDDGAVRPWGAHEIAMRMLNNLVAAYQRRGDLGRAIRAAEMRLELPAERSLRGTLRTELQAMRARLN